MTVQLLIDNFFGNLTEGPERTEVSDKEEKEEEESVYEQPTNQVVIHSVNCQELIGCSCTPQSDSDRFSEERAAAIKRLHAGRNERARQRQRKAAGNAGTTSGTTAANTDDWDSLGDLGPI